MKFSTSARGFVLIHTSTVHRSSLSVEKHLSILKNLQRIGFYFKISPKPAIIKQKNTFRHISLSINGNSQLNHVVWAVR